MQKVIPLLQVPRLEKSLPVPRGHLQQSDDLGSQVRLAPRQTPRSEDPWSSQWTLIPCWHLNRLHGSWNTGYKPDTAKFPPQTGKPEGKE